MKMSFGIAGLILALIALPAIGAESFQAGAAP